MVKSNLRVSQDRVSVKCSYLVIGPRFVGANRYLKKIRLKDDHDETHQYLLGVNLQTIVQLLQPTQPTEVDALVMRPLEF